MTTIHETDVLVSKTKAGTEKFWQGIVLQNGPKYFRQTRTWQITKTGKKSKEQLSVPYEVFPKNEGRSNATTAKIQALKEMESVVKKQYDKGYTKPGEKSNVLPLPMLAKKFSDLKKGVQFPVWVQPKYNGMRMLYDGTKGWSRGGKDIIPEVIQHLKIDTHGHILDGELILPDMPILQETMKAAKKFYPGLSDTLVYVVYDIVDPNMTFAERLATYSWILAQRTNLKVIPAPATKVSSEKEIWKIHKEYVDTGFEGTMIRLPSKGYEIGHRSDQLLKLKNFQDAEFKIVDVIDGEGKFKHHAIFVCKTEDGVQFNCTPEGDMESRAKMFKNRSEYIDKYLTVRYFELTKDGVPQFPIGVDVREKGDF